MRGFVVATRFDDGTEKQVDISQWFKGPVFKALRESKFFKKFFIEAGTLAWPNGVDIAPEALYQAEDVRSVGRRTESALINLAIHLHEIQLRVAFVAPRRFCL